MLSKEPSIVQASVPNGVPSPALRTSALIVLGCVFTAAFIAYLLADFHLSFGRNAVAAAAVLLLFIFGLVIKGLDHHGFERFGIANAVTAVRAAFVSLIGAIVFFSGEVQYPQSTTWALLVLVFAALALDGADGHLARRYGEESDLGARFDMEVDALLIFCLSGAAFLSGKVGPWVLLIGLMRYGFVLAQFIVPRLKSPLPPSLRRKLVCVVQVAVMCLILVPGIVAPVSSWLAAIALLLLSYSFAVDCLSLLGEAETGE